jgi:hypothetical protein
MFKRFGILALMLSATGVAVLPKAAFAQDGYYAPRDNYHQVDRDRHEAREWRERGRQAEEWRECAARDHRPDAYFGSDHRR